MSETFNVEVWTGPLPVGRGWGSVRRILPCPVRFFWLLAHPMSAYYFEANAGEEQ